MFTPRNKTPRKYLIYKALIVLKVTLKGFKPLTF